jgi:serine protease Do
VASGLPRAWLEAIREGGEMTRALHLILGLALLAGCNGDDRAPPVTPDASATAPTPAATAPATAPSAPATTAAPPNFTALVERVGPAVVHVTTEIGGSMQVREDHPLEEFLRRFSPTPPQPRGGGIGSGFLIDDEGRILTNAHVVARAEQVTVRLADGKQELRAEVIGVDPQTDIALLKVEANGLPVAPIGKSASLKPGEWVAAIGSPFGFANTITAGIVSATERALPNETLVPFIQTDVAVNPGNSGGPLLNTQGEVVGINSQIFSRTGGYMGVSFAIPIDVAMDIARQLRTEGRVTRGRLGVGIQPITRELANAFGLDEPRGALITRIEPDSPAEKAGLQVGDVIVSAGQKPIADIAALPRLIAGTPPGTELSLEVWRQGQSQSVPVTIGASETAETTAAAPSKPGEKSDPGRLGVVVSELPPEGRRALDVPFGLIVREVDDKAANSGLRPGDVIVGIQQQRFDSFKQFRQLLAEVPEGGTAALLVRRGEQAAFVPVPVG